MTIDYQCRMRGNLTALAKLTTEQITAIEQEEKGHVLMPVTIYDEYGQQPIECQIEWGRLSKNSK